jgi:Fe-S-cluster containining protein
VFAVDSGAGIERAMGLEEKRERLREVYRRFEHDVAELKKAAVCVPGCASCCIDVGNVDVTTLEGLIIFEQLGRLERQIQEGVRSRLARNKMEREQGRLSRCAFLQEDSTCMIYEFRPFSCRQLYSVSRCAGTPPTLHRYSVARARETVKEIQRIDCQGYSGHISYILYLLEQQDFRRLYLRGKSKPGKIAAFGRSHGILINRVVSQRTDP